MRIHPGGYVNNEGTVCQFLQNMSDGVINIKLSSGILCEKGLIVYSSNETHSIGPFSVDSHSVRIGKGRIRIIRSRLLLNSDNVTTSYLVDGTLVIELRMKLDGVNQATSSPFIPENPSACKVIQNMFMDEKSSDVVIEVGVQEAKGNAKKKAKTTSLATFHAHRNILQQCASVLFEMCGSGETHSSIQITDVSPDIFRHLLYYIYGGKVSNEDMKINATGIIDASDKYGVSKLKLEAEASLVNSTTFTVDNVMGHLLYADSKNCALLKESIMDFILQNKVEVLKKVSFKDTPGSLVSDVLAAVARGENKGGTSESNDVELSTMRISDLRRKVHEKGLEVDGSREAMIAALEGSS